MDRKTAALVCCGWVAETQIISWFCFPFFSMLILQLFFLFNSYKGRSPDIQVEISTLVSDDCLETLMLLFLSSLPTFGWATWILFLPFFPPWAITSKLHVVPSPSAHRAQLQSSFCALGHGWNADSSSCVLVGRTPLCPASECQLISVFSSARSCRD